MCFKMTVFHFARPDLVLSMTLPHVREIAGCQLGQTRPARSSLLTPAARWCCYNIDAGKKHGSRQSNISIHLGLKRIWHVLGIYKIKGQHMKIPQTKHDIP